MAEPSREQFASVGTMPILDYQTSERDRPINLRRIAWQQRAMCYCIFGELASGLGFAMGPNWAAYVALTFFVFELAGAVLVILLARRVCEGAVAALFIFYSCVPILNFVALIAIAQEARAFLVAHDVPVGWMWAGRVRDWNLDVPRDGNSGDSEAAVARASFEGVVVRAIATDDVAMFKSLRLAALQDSPLAFGSTYAKESVLSDEQWTQRVRKWSGEKSLACLAWDGAAACGIVAGFVDEQNPSLAHLVSMWVAPTHRRRGVGRMLVTAIIDWASRQRVNELRLNVTSSNARAIKFYRGMGFTFTGRSEAYPNDPNLIELEMAMVIEPTMGT